MNLKDPFNRLSGKQQREYLALQEQLQQAGIDSREKAQNLLQQSRKRMLMVCLAVVLITLGAMLVAPQTMGVSGVFGGLVLLWLVMTLVRGQRLLRQYIAQEFSESPSE